MRAWIAMAIAVFLAGSTALIVLSAPANAITSLFAYIANSGNDTVSRIDLATNQVTATIPVQNQPHGVAITPDGKRVYVTNVASDSVSVIDTRTNAVLATITNQIGNGPFGVAITPDGTRAYVTNRFSDSVSVIDTRTNAVLATITNQIGNGPFGVAITPDGTRAYVTNRGSDSVSVIDTTTNTVSNTINVRISPMGVAITPDGTRAYVANNGPVNGTGSISVINTKDFSVIDIPLPNGRKPRGISITPDGARAYAATDEAAGGTVSVIDTGNNNVTTVLNFIGSGLPQWIAITPDGSRAYITLQGIPKRSDSVASINIAGNTQGPSTLLGAANSLPDGIAIGQASSIVPRPGADTSSLVPQPGANAVREYTPAYAHNSSRDGVGLNVAHKTRNRHLSRSAAGAYSRHLARQRHGSARSRYTRMG